MGGVNLLRAKYLIEFSDSRLNKHFNFQFCYDNTSLGKHRLAKDLNCHITTVTHWLTGETEPQKQNLIDIAKRFNVRVEDLDGDEFPQIIKNDPVTVDGDKVEEIIRLFLTLPADAQDRVISYLRFEHSQL